MLAPGSCAPLRAPGLPQSMNRLPAMLLAAAALMLAALHVHPADMTKTLRVAFAVDVTGFDPQVTQDLYSSYIERAVFDPLLTYDHLARPYKIVPNTAAALPEVRDGGRT